MLLFSGFLSFFCLIIKTSCGQAPSSICDLVISYSVSSGRVLQVVVKSCLVTKAALRQTTAVHELLRWLSAGANTDAAAENIAG